MMEGLREENDDKLKPLLSMSRRPSHEAALVETLAHSSANTSFISGRRYSTDSAPISWAEHLRSSGVGSIPPSPFLTPNLTHPRSPFTPTFSDSYDISNYETGLPQQGSSINKKCQSFKIVLSSFVLQSLSTGLIYSFGIFQEHLTNKTGEKVFDFDVGLSTAAFVGAIATATNSFASLPIGIACEAYSHRRVAMFSAILIPFSLILASFSNQMWHLYITHGFLFGLGCSLANLPSTALPVIHFSYGGIASGIASSGAGLGGLVLACLNGYLLKKIGYRNTLRTNSLLTLILLSVASLLIPKTLKESRHSYASRLWARGRSSDGLSGLSAKLKGFLNLFKENYRRMILFGFVGIFHSIAFFIPFYFVPLFVTSELHLNWFQGALVVGIMGVSSGAGQIIFGFIGDAVISSCLKSKTILGLSVGNRLSMVSLLNKGKHPHPFQTYSLLWCTTLAISSLCFTLWLLICIQPLKTKASFAQLQTGGVSPPAPSSILTGVLFLFGILFGFFSGGSMSYSPMVAKEMFGTKQLTSIIGFYQTFRGFGYLLGTPLGGNLIGENQMFGYRSIFLFGSLSLVFASCSALLCWHSVINHVPTYGPYAIFTNQEISPFLNTSQSDFPGEIIPSSPESPSTLVPSQVIGQV